MTFANLPTQPFRRKPGFGGLWFREIDLPQHSDSIIKGLLGRSAMSVIFGESGCGKSFFALDLSLYIAADWAWRGRKVKAGAVAYIAAEGGHGMRKRVIAFRQHHAIPDDADLPFLLIPNRVDLLDPKADTEALIEEIQSAARDCGHPVQLVVIDTLSRAIAGGNENSPDAMGAFVANCDRIRQETQAHVCIVHHSGKDTAKGARGHSLLRAATDTEIEIKKDEATSTATARLSKQKDGEEGDEFAFTLERVTVGTDEDGEDITSCVVEIAEPSAKRHRCNVHGAAKVALDMLRKALAEAGETPPTSNHIPGHLHVVTVSLWRRYCAAGNVTGSDKPDTQTKAFKRAADRLQSLGLIGVWDGWVWLTE